MLSKRRVSSGILVLSMLSFFAPGATSVTSASISGFGSGLSMFYPLEEGSGLITTDQSGNSYNGNLTNGPTWTAGKIGNALSFDNVNDYVSIPFDPAIAEGAAITVAAWVKPSTISDAGGTIVAKDRSGFTQWKLRIDGRSANNLKNNLTFTVGSVTAMSDNEVMADLGWHHVVGVYNGSQVYVYMDGANVDSTANPLTGNIPNYPHYVCIGTSGTTCNESNFFGGLIDDVRVYNRALSPAEIQDLFNGVSTPIDTGAPTVNLTAPADGSTVVGTTAVTANATDNVGVADVQFTLDGANLGAEDTTAPYSFSWNTAATTNGTHILGATAHDNAGNTTSATTVSVTVANPIDVTPPVITGVAAAVTSSTATVTWSTNEASDSQIEYGLTSTYGSVTSLNTNLVTSHSQAITGLSAATTYHYRVLSKDAPGNAAASMDFTFTTAAAPLLVPSIYYPLDETSGTVAADLGGNGYNGNLVNGPAWFASGKINGALNLDNVNDYVSIPFDPVSAEGSQITVNAWVKPSTITDAGGAIVAKERSGFSQWKLRIDGRSGNNAKNNLSFSVGSVTATSDNEVMADLGWHMVTGVYDGSHVYVYMDGVNVDSTANPLTGPIPNYPHNICIGTTGSTCTESNFFGGLVDDVKIFNRALSSAEVQQLMAASSDTTVKVNVVATDANAAETGLGTGTFTITRTGSIANSLDVKYAISGTATSGADFQPLSGVATIPAGATTVAVTVTPIDDMEIEANETVMLTLSPDPAYGFNQPTADIVTIADNDTLADSIIIDHNSVDLYDKIPQTYIDRIKTMWLDVPGESESRTYVNGLRYVAQRNPNLAASITESGPPEGPRTDALRVSNASWGDLDNSTGWFYWYGEEDWYTSDLAKQRTKAHIQYVNNLGNPANVIGFGWCVDMCRGNTGYSQVDPVYGTRWSGSSVGGAQGDKPWGLDAEDFALTGNSVNLDTYLTANKEYQDYADANSIPTKVFLATGPLRDECGGVNVNTELAYQGSLKNERIRQYARTHQGSILFDFADIVAHNNAGVVTYSSWMNSFGNIVTYEAIHADNMTNFDGNVVVGQTNDTDGDHIGQEGTLRIGKASWVLMARLAGWDGVSTQ
ncbi:MAG: hypothetical protein KW802_02370 [Candidatus Doudnabacteria bacterium]|nr:hypothetical protein [Candidatus Doudnabacteria bacterium]